MDNIEPLEGLLQKKYITHQDTAPIWPMQFSPTTFHPQKCVQSTPSMAGNVLTFTAIWLWHKLVVHSGDWQTS
ncbi:MAG: hypothetical protein HC767_03740 [Akkermansiaceae bacterium]|nr:hypothetical protein [Akkermansiaceae bacterium]